MVLSRERESVSGAVVWCKAVEGMVLYHTIPYHNHTIPYHSTSLLFISSARYSVTKTDRLEGLLCAILNRSDDEEVRVVLSSLQIFPHRGTTPAARIQIRLMPLHIRLGSLSL